MVTEWSVYGQFNGKYVWSVCGQWVVNMWSVGGQHVVTEWSVSGQHVVSWWSVCVVSV